MLIVLVVMLPLQPLNCRLRIESRRGRRATPYALSMLSLSFPFDGWLHSYAAVNHDTGGVGGGVMQSTVSCLLPTSYGLSS